jgi:hypothetical protein
MTVYVFGNPDVDLDSAATTATKLLQKRLSHINFKFIPPNADVSFDTAHPVILDVIADLKKITVLTNLDQIIPPPRTTVHDFDLGFQLKYLKKIGQINGATIIGLPQNQKINYLRIQSILRKLVAQDIQGS